MIDPNLVASLLQGLETRFLLITWSWCNGIVQESFEEQAGRPPLGKKEKELIQGHGALMCRRIMSEFFFGWLLQIEVIARNHDGGVVRLSRFDDALTYISGQTIYDLFAGGGIRGPYGLPWDNAVEFRERVLKPAASLMRSFQKDDAMKIPPEARKLLELRGLRIEP
jgi:hypothetical protein